ncbi:MAG: addiction module protein [Steroidobacteraceae bacterium]|jgi:hypothetical protein|nr:addiction module protein [Steroidobacteraceae bacterium]
MSSNELERARRLVFALPRHEQLKLAAQMLATTNGRLDSTLEASWTAAIEQRMADSRCGSAEYVDPAEFIRQTRVRLAQSART